MGSVAPKIMMILIGAVFLVVVGFLIWFMVDFVDVPLPLAIVGAVGSGVWVLLSECRDRARAAHQAETQTAGDGADRQPVCGEVRLGRVGHEGDTFPKGQSVALDAGLPELRGLPPPEFERFVCGVFARRGYEVRHTGQQGDHGVDAVLSRDGMTFAVQAKRFAEGQNVGEPSLREFCGSLGDYDAVAGFFVTTSSFTNAARTWAERRGGQVSLIDGQTLLAMMSDPGDKEVQAGSAGGPRDVPGFSTGGATAT